MVTEKDLIDRLQQFLKNLRQGEFSSQVEQAFEELNIVIGQYQAAQTYLRDEYLPGLCREGKTGRQQLLFIANGALRYAVSSLAHTVAEALIAICSSVPYDDEVLGILLEIVLKYEHHDLISVESGQILRLETGASRFSLSLGSIRLRDRLDLLRLALRKYGVTLVTHGPPSSQELPAIIHRVNSVIGLILQFDDKTEMINRAAFRPFLSEGIRYTQQRSQRLFDTDLGCMEYDERLFEVYRVPLFPVVESDKLGFHGTKMVFVNEGHGTLPSSAVQVEVGDKQFGLGELLQPVPPDEVVELFVDEREAFFDFLHKQTPNLDVKVVFSFRKFGRSYDFGLLARSVGSWLEQVPRSVQDRSIPYEIPISRLDERGFERLCMWIVEDEPDGIKFKDVVWLNEDGGGERGRDVIAAEVETEKKWVFQCKRVVQFGPSDIEGELTTFAKYIEEDPSIKPDVYVLFISRSITDRVKAKGDELAAKIGLEIKYWPKSKIDRLVRINRNVKDRFWAAVQE